MQTNPLSWCLARQLRQGWVHAHLESGTLGERRSVKLMSSTIWGFCILCSPPPSIGPRKNALHQEVLCPELHWLKVWMPSPDDILLAVSNPVHPDPSLLCWDLDPLKGWTQYVGMGPPEYPSHYSGFPYTLPPSSLNYMLESNNIESMIFQRKLNSIISLDNN